jgi:hypothetical protein
MFASPVSTTPTLPLENTAAELAHRPSMLPGVKSANPPPLNTILAIVSLPLPPTTVT